MRGQSIIMTPPVAVQSHRPPRARQSRGSLDRDRGSGERAARRRAGRSEAEGRAGGVRGRVVVVIRWGNANRAVLIH